MIYLFNIISSVFIFTHSFALCSAQKTTTELLQKIEETQCNGQPEGTWTSNGEQTCRITVETGYKLIVTIVKFYLNSGDPDNKDQNTVVVITPDEMSNSNGKPITLTWNVPKQSFIFASNLTLQFHLPRPLTPKEEFSIHWKKYGNKSVTTVAPPSTPVYPTPNPNNTDPYYYTAYLFGKDPNSFISDATPFKELLANKAMAYCLNNHIPLDKNITKYTVQITLAIRCFYLWPDADKCVEVHFAIPANVQNAKDYELSYTHLEGIWKEISDNDLKQAIGWIKYTNPSDSFTLTKWVLIGSVIVFGGLLLVTIYLSKGIKFTGKTRQENTEANEAIDPATRFQINGFQSTPQMFEEDVNSNVYHYQQMHAHTNPAYVFADDLSDEERFDIRQRPPGNNLS